MSKPVDTSLSAAEILAQFTDANGVLDKAGAKDYAFKVHQARVEQAKQDQHDANKFLHDEFEAVLAVTGRSGPATGTSGANKI